MNMVNLLFAGLSVLLVLVSLPLLFRRIPPNAFYGLRVPATYADEWVWYEANARHLARTGYASQQYDGPPSGRRDNLFHPVDDRVDHGAHGAFDARAHGRSIELWAVKRRPWLAAAVAVIGLAGAAFLISKKLQVVT